MPLPIPKSKNVTHQSPMVHTNASKCDGLIHRRQILKNEKTSASLMQCFNQMILDAISLTQNKSKYEPWIKRGLFQITVYYTSHRCKMIDSEIWWSAQKSDDLRQSSIFCTITQYISANTDANVWWLPFIEWSCLLETRHAKVQW